MAMTWTRRPTTPLLCELHAHTRWSDGELTMEELVDLYGRNRFDVLCITDHALGPDDPYGPMVGGDNHAAYLDEIRVQAQRAERTYLAAHALAIGLERPVSLGDGLETALRQARAMVAALIAAHPHGAEGDAIPMRTTRRFDGTSARVHR
jgi:hypothetical protein